MKRLFLLSCISASLASFFFTSQLLGPATSTVEIEFPSDFEPIVWDEDALSSTGSVKDRSPSAAKVYSTISSRPGRRKAPIKGASTFHKGTDYSAKCGTPVPAKAGGKVKIANYRQGYGKTVAIEISPKCRAIYAHLSKISVKVGQKVSAGQMIGKVGSSGISTGCHLHYEGCSKLYAMDDDLQDILEPIDGDNDEAIQSAQWLPQENQESL